jgi:hypothetical protein
MNGLGKQNAPTLLCPQLFGSSGAIQKVSIVKGLYEPEFSELTAFDYRPSQGDWRIETVARANKQMDARSLCFSDHGLTVCDRYCQWLIDQDMLSSASCRKNMVPVDLVRSCHVDRLDRGISAQGLNGVIRLATKLAYESFATFGPGRGSCYQLDAWICPE